MRLNNGNCAISSTQIDMRIYTVAETKILYFKRDYSLCDFVVQAHNVETKKMSPAKSPNISGFFATQTAIFLCTKTQM